MSEIDTAATRLRMIVRLLIRRAYSVAHADGPTRSEQGVMVWLDEKGEMTPKALADIEKVRPQTMGQTLDALDRRQWISRTPHPTDRRQILISLSPSGRTVLQESRQRRQAWLVEALGKLSPADQKTLFAALDVLDRLAQS